MTSTSVAIDDESTSTSAAGPSSSTGQPRKRSARPLTVSNLRMRARAAAEQDGEPTRVIINVEEENVAEQDEPSTSAEVIEVPLEPNEEQTVEETPMTVPNGKPETNGLPAGAPAVLPPTSAASKFSLMTKLLRRKNRVHNTESTEQSEFMQKYGVGNGTGPQEAAAPDNEAIQGPRWKRYRHTYKTFTVDPASDRYYYWNVVVSVAFVYNLVFVIARQEMPVVKPYADMGWSEHVITRGLWFTADVLMDLIYLLDIFVRTRTGYLDQGLVVRDVDKIKKIYFASTQWKMDLASIVPLDYIIGWPWPISWFRALPIIRVNRLLRVSRAKDCMERTETRSSMPNAFRVLVVVWYIVIIIHWNACFYFWISETIGLGSDMWVYGHLNKQSLPDDVPDTLVRRYIYSFYWSTLILTTIGEVPSPVQNIEFVFVTLDLMCGVLIFATIVGNVGSMISNMSAARTEFQNKMDGIKQYMELRKVSKQLEIRVIKWFDYLWANKQSLSDQQVLKVLPDKLQAEIAMQVHFETLRKVRIFQDCEAGLLAELVLKLQLQVFSPGDYICRKGDIGREMYIVKRGRLQVVADDGLQIFATLSEGSVFGELSILNIAGSKNGNRRTANVRSVGYTDLFVLNKNDLWNALREYPDARKLLLAKGRDILKKDNLLIENAPEEQQSVEEVAEQLNASVKILQHRMARLIGEHSSTETKLMKRIEILEKQLARYKGLARRQKSIHGVSLDGSDAFDRSRSGPRLRHQKTHDGGAPSRHQDETEKLLTSETSDV
ncbi:unnamed protein product [Caenorhabditis auriculariae]|uniref:Cyclic nucleotide-binding domain-containing protein n=1 Tax=Caenorhabditis auriculariae TaxID=2777116 RepID=A0A8S1GRD2_9PELO|nr:unnamed protein product [Caenorhabditis auriculariae]